MRIIGMCTILFGESKVILSLARVYLEPNQPEYISIRHSDIPFAYLIEIRRATPYSNGFQILN